MNQSVSTLVAQSYAPRANAFDPKNECVSTILSAPLGDGCVGTSIVARERADSHYKRALGAVSLVGAARAGGFF